MVKAVNEEFWKMVKESIHDQTLKFKGMFSLSSVCVCVVCMCV